MEHKLVTIFLHDKFDGAKGSYGEAAAGPFFGVKEHLSELLEQGWTIKEIQTIGGAGGGLSGWIVAVLEKKPY